MFPSHDRTGVTHGPMGSYSASGFNGAFFVVAPNRTVLQIISSVEKGWEHVSVCPKTKKRVPTWEEMCYIKELFWEDNEWVVQYHPAKSDYVNNHPYVLHLWKPIDIEFPKPPSIMVGIKATKKRRNE